MLSAQSYIDKIHESRDFIFAKRLLRYRTDFVLYADLQKHSQRLLTNLCKLVFVLSNMPFNGMSDKDIVSYVECNYPIGGYISRYIECYDAWVMFSKRNDIRNKERYLKSIIGYSEVIENELIDAYGLPVNYTLMTNFDTKRG